MAYSSSSTVVAFKSAKQAALYCEHVVPMEFAELIPVRDSGEPQLFDILQKVLPPSLLDSSAPRLVHPGIVTYLSTYLVAFPQVMGITSLPNGETLEQRAKSQLPGLYSNMANVLTSVAEPINGVLDIDPLGTAAIATDDVSCQLAGLNIIDVEKVSWKHLLAFREDAESVKQLQHLRLFFQEKFDGKPKEFVRDSLLVAIDKHDETVKKWGFETVTGVMESVFSSKSLAALGAGTVTIVLGAPIAVGAAIAAAFEVGSATIKIVSKRRALAEFRKFDPVSYLIGARELPKA
jgi:hypothetical protein